MLKKEEEPDALVLDLMLPGRTGNELLSTIKCMLPNAKIFIFSAREQSIGSISKKCIEGFFLKTDGIKNLVEAINNAFAIPKKEGWG